MNRRQVTPPRYRRRLSEHDGRWLAAIVVLYLAAAYVTLLLNQGGPA